jgi:hypothetical protein
LSSFAHLLLLSVSIVSIVVRDVCRSSPTPTSGIHEASIKNVGVPFTSLRTPLVTSCRTFPTLVFAFPRLLGARRLRASIPHPPAAATETAAAVSFGEVRMPAPLGTRRPSPRLVVIICFALALAAGACHQNIEVRTVTAPGASFVGRHTFRILTPRYTGTAALASNDPMLVNSITNQALRDEIRRDFESRGYVYAPDRADLDVAFYALARPVTDIRTFDYGYTWRGFPRQAVDVVQYEQGTVIIDVIDPATRQLMWRGQGSAPVSSDPNKYTDVLGKAVQAIVDKFPPAS